MQKPNILIVDDEIDVRERLQSFITRRIDCGIVTASDGAEAIEKIKNNSFDLMLLDMKMPGLDGIDVIKNTAVSSPHTKILVISAYDSKEIADQAIKAGARDYITKPYTADEIVIKVQDILSLS